MSPRRGAWLARVSQRPSAATVFYCSPVVTPGGAGCRCVEFEHNDDSVASTAVRRVGRWHFNVLSKCRGRAFMSHATSVLILASHADCEKARTPCRSGSPLTFTDTVRLGGLSRYRLSGRFVFVQAEQPKEVSYLASPSAEATSAPLPPFHDGIR